MSTEARIKQLEEELAYIKETFEAAVNNSENKGDQQAPYHGDFSSIPPSCVTQMRRWINRWEIILNQKVND